MAAEKSGDHQYGTIEKHADAIARLHPTGRELKGDRARRALQLAVVYSNTATSHCGGFRRTAGLIENLPRQQVHLGLARLGTPGVLAKLVLLLPSHYRHVGRAAFEIVRQVLEQRFVMAEQFVHPELLKPVRAILDGDLERALTLGDEEGQIELRRPQVQRDRFESSLPELWRGRGLLVDEHGLKDGVSVSLPRRR